LYITVFLGFFMSLRIVLLPGDGIGPEIMAQAEKVLILLKKQGLAVQWHSAFIGGAAVDAAGLPFPEATQQAVQAADAVLLAAVGAPQYDGLPRHLRPERGLLALRQAMGVFANLRPARLLPVLANASALKKAVVADLDLMIVRELTGGIYFGQPRGIREVTVAGVMEREGFNTLHYRESEIVRVAEVAFQLAQQRQKRLCSVDKANVLETSELWREVVSTVGKRYPEVSLSHMYVDNAAMQLVRDPKQFDVLLTDNLFGDILSDQAAMLTGSIGMLPSAALNAEGKGLYEPIHGSAPDIASQDKANPLAMLLSLAMLLRHSAKREDLAQALEKAIESVLLAGIRTADIAEGGAAVGCQAMGEAVVDALQVILS
jgi:3-isopropylmalate dehydrogenase